jgi:hypothetical protein
MIGFFIKKAFYGIWDNLFKIVLLNLIFLLLTAIPFFLPSLVAKFYDSQILNVIIIIVGILLCFIYLSAAAFSVKHISDYSTFAVRDLLKNFKEAWPAGIVMGLFAILLFFVFTYIIPFYLSFESAAGLVLAAIVFWAAIFALLSFQFYFTVYVRLGKNIVKSFKKCMLISLDNSGYSLFMLLHNLFVLGVSVIFAFLFPGPVGVLLYLDESVRLRLLKYDWLEENPGANRRKVPWDVLLIDEREKTGDRTFKNFIFPWKD